MSFVRRKIHHLWAVTIWTIVIVVFLTPPAFFLSDSELDVGDKSFDNELPSTSQNGHSNNPLSQTLHEGTDVTIHDSYMQYLIQHCLAPSDLLKLMGMLLPTKSIVKSMVPLHSLDLYDYSTLLFELPFAS